MREFDYGTAFSRNLGWVTNAEQSELRRKRVAIAGLGGVGGIHLLTLTRLGIGSFVVADLDRFELANFNRQPGAFLSSLDHEKSKVLANMAKDINPDLDLRLFPEGVNVSNLNSFLDDVDLYVDGLDFFEIQIRRAIFERCAELGIPAITAAPLGMGAAIVNFLPGSMSFETYFQLDGVPEDDQLVRFLVGLSPTLLQRAYLVDRSAVDFGRHKGPSTVMACEMCAGMAGVQALKILLKRGKVLSAPFGQHFDPYRNCFRTTWRPFGNRNPLNRIAIALARRILKRDAA